MHNDLTELDYSVYRRAQGAYDPFPDHPGLPMAEYPKRGRALSLRGYAYLVGAALGVGVMVAAISRGWI